MIEAKHKVGDTCPVQFVWELPEGDFLRAIFQTTVIALHHDTARYLLRLDKFAAGRQESASGEMRPPEAVNKEYWQMVHNLIGRKIDLAYEAADGQAIRLRLPTLTLEHQFFTRYQ